jgi:serine/threonine-protein kinase
MSAPQVIGRYEIISQLGRGAMGSVFKARDPAVGRVVALKTIHASALEGEQSDEYRARFHREARASGVLAHPGIVPVFDVGDHDGAPFLVMEFVDGRTLADAIKKGERFSIDRVCEIGQQIADALGYAHRQGVIHRDVKPANILLTSREVYGSERPRITDFGIAKLAAMEITTTGQLLGTPAFMPPEQFTGMPVDGRADIFSLGVILYALVTGEQPFAGETVTAVSYKVVHIDPIPPSKLNPAVPHRLEAVILKSLAKNPAERYQTCEELEQDLTAIRAASRVSTLNAMAPATDTNATLGPSQGSLHASQPAVVNTAQSATPAPGTPLPAAVPGKRAQWENIFPIVLLAVAGIGAAGAGVWFIYQHAMHRAAWVKHQAAGSSPSTPIAPLATVPQPVLTAPVSGRPPAQPSTAAPSATQNSKAPQPANTKSSPAKPSPSGSAITNSKSPPASSTPSPATKNSTVAASTPPPAPSAPSSVPSAATPKAAAVAAAAFDPRKLDPNSSTRLKIELNKMPGGLPIVVQMNRKPYLSFVTGDKTDLENLYVPAGVQEFRVAIKSGGQEHDSNTVSDDFKAKKKKTLKIEILQNGKSPSGGAAALDSNAQVFLSFPIFSF